MNHTVVSFVIPDEPVSKSRHRMGLRGGRVVSYKDAKTTNAQARVGQCYLAACDGLEPNAVTGFTVYMTFYVKRRQRRDVDNFIKLILDGLTPLAWGDDSQVTEIHARIVHGSDDPRTEVSIASNDDLPDWKRRTCDYCGTAFHAYASTSSQRFCNRKCAYASRTKTCEGCGKQYHKTDDHRGAKFCSQECYVKSKQVELECSQCGAHFWRAASRKTKHAFCSDDCFTFYWQAQRKSAAVGVCMDCGGPTTKKTYLRCQPCRFKQLHST